MSGCNGEKRGQDVIVFIRKLLKDFKRLIARLDRGCGITSEGIDVLEDGLDELARSGGTIGLSIPRHRRPRRPQPPAHWYASKIVLSQDGPSTFVVGGVAYEKELTALEFDLVSILKAPTKESPDDLVGFRTRDSIVKALREKYSRPQATARSVIVGISRLRETLGPTYGALVEWSAGLGYRLRVLPP